MDPAAWRAWGAGAPREALRAFLPPGSDPREALDPAGDTLTLRVEASEELQELLERIVPDSE